MLKYEIKTLEGRGRSLIAKDGYKKGELILDEEPFAMVVSQGYSEVACGHCGKLCINGTVYVLSEEDYTKYCSETCIQTDHKIHLLEVDAVRLLKNIQISNINLDSLKLILRCAALRKVEQGLSEIPIKSFADVLNLESVESGLSQMETKDIEQIIDKLDKICKIRKLPMTQSEIKSLLFSIQCNAHRIINKNNQHIALGLFPLISMINHSCVPNCTHYFELSEEGKPPKMVIRAIVDIPTGEEVVYSYVPLYQATRSRKSQLLSAYGFDCTCVKCVSNTALSDRSVPSDDQSVEYVSGSPEDLLLAPLKDMIREFSMECAAEEQSSVESNETWLRRLIGALKTISLVTVDGDSSSTTSTVVSINATNKYLLQFYVTISKLAAGLAMPPSAVPSESHQSIRLLHTSLMMGLLALGCIYRQIEAVELEAVQIELSLAYVCRKLAVLHSVEMDTTPSEPSPLDLSGLSIGDNNSLVGKIADKINCSETLFTLSSETATEGVSSSQPSLLPEWSALITSALSHILTGADVRIFFSTSQTDSAWYAELSSVLIRYASDRHLVCRGELPQLVTSAPEVEVKSDDAVIAEPV